MSDDAGWEYLGSAKEASDRAARLGHQQGLGRSQQPTGATEGTAGGGLLGVALEIFVVVITGFFQALWWMTGEILKAIFSGGRRRRR